MYMGMRRVGGQKRKGSEWWNEEVGWVVVMQKNVFFAVFLCFFSDLLKR